MKRECFQQLYDFAGVSKGVKHFCNASAFDELFVIQMRDYVGNPYLFRVEDFPDLTYSVSGNSFNMKFSGVVLLAGTTVEVTVSRDDKSVLYWNIFITPGRDDFKVEWVNFPRVVFSSPGCKYLIPNAEGAEISDLADRQENGFFKCNLVEYPMTGSDSFYPGPAAMQFEALYDTVAGLYIGCHDKSDQPKVIDFYPEGKGGICVLQQFTGGAGTPGYAVEMHSFRGDWQDAADIYRNWLEKEQLMPEKLVDNMPEVLDASPVVIAYPVKGVGSDNGGLDPNEYFPYINALPVMERYNKLWNNSVMALLMHWEGSAPWASPFIWPPHGGEAMLKEYIDAMHARGNSVGLYASGISWTQKSMIDTSYTLEERFIADNVKDEICIGPRGEAWASVCNSPLGQRIGYELCPSREYTAKTVCGEVSSASKLGVDYLQYFDQNQGCVSPLCYSKEHDHPELPGEWQTRAMQQLLSRTADAAGKTLIGCENAAAQPYINVCKLNDLRNFLCWGMGGVPVAVYSYLFHEYTAGFSGNGVWIHGRIDLDKTEFFPVWNLAWNFVSGNLLSVILKDKGEIHWNWCRMWDVPPPDQDELIKLIGNLSEHRRGDMKKFLVSGRMIKAPAIECGKRVVNLFRHKPVEVPSVLHAAWESEGCKVVILANSMTEPSECRLVFDREYELEYENSSRRAGAISITVPPLDTVMVKFK